MAGNVTGLHRFADDVGPEPLSLLDTNYDALTQALNTLNTFSNFYVDTGTTNAYTITVPSTQPVSYADGLTVLVRLATTNTGPATLNINNLGPKPILHAATGPLQPNDLYALQTVVFVYDAAANAFVVPTLGGGGGGGGGTGTFVAPFTVTNTAGTTNFLNVDTNGTTALKSTGNDTVLVVQATDPAFTNNAAGIAIEAPFQLPGAWAETIFGYGAAAGCSNGLVIRCGTNASDSPLWIQAAGTTPAGGNTFMQIKGDGSGVLGPAPNQLVWDNAGHFTLTGTATLPGGGGGGASYLSQLLDVSIAAQANGQVLTWNSTSSRWTNQTPMLAGLGDVGLSGLTPNQVLTYNGVRWANQNVTVALAGLSDVALTSPTAGQILGYNGTKWINQAPTVAGGGSPFTAPFYINASGGASLFATQATGTNTTIYSPVGSAGQSLLVEGAITPSSSSPGYVMQVAGGSVATTGQWLLGLIGYSAAAGCGNGLLIEAGTNASDSPLTVKNQANTSTFFAIHGDGTGALGASANNMTWTTNGFTFTSTVMGTAPLTVVQPPATTAGIWLWNVGSSTPSGSSPGCSNGMLIYSGTNASDSALKVLSDGGAKTFLNLKGDGSGVIGPASSWDVNGVWTFGPTNTGVEQIIRGAPHTTQGLWKFQIGGGPSGDATDCSNGIYIGAGTSANDVSIWVQNDAGTTTYFMIRGDGSGALGPAPNQMIWNAAGNFTMTGSAVAPHAALSASPDIAISNLQDGQVLAWDATNSKWINVNLPGGGGPISLASLSDALITTPLNGQMLIYNGSDWTNGSTITGALNIDGLPGVDTLTVHGGYQQSPQFWVANFISSAPVGNNSGVRIEAGSNNMDMALNVLAIGGTTTLLAIAGDGALYCTPRTATVAGNTVTMRGSEICQMGSSIRFKRDVRSMAREKARETLAGLRAVSYRSRCEYDDPSVTSYGLIAEEVAAVDPNLVTFDSNGLPLGVQYDRIALLLLPLVQELLESRA